LKEKKNGCIVEITCGVWTQQNKIKKYE